MTKKFARTIAMKKFCAIIRKDNGLGGFVVRRNYKKER